MPDLKTGTTTIKFGSVLQISYRLTGSAGPYTQVPHYPGPNELPYTFSVPTAGTWDIQLIEICPTCANANKFSEPVIVTVSVS
jgi:hypothetical protein